MKILIDKPPAQQNCYASCFPKYFDVRSVGIKLCKMAQEEGCPYLSLPNLIQTNLKNKN